MWLFDLIFMLITIWDDEKTVGQNIGKIVVLFSVLGVIVGVIFLWAMS